MSAADRNALSAALDAQDHGNYPQAEAALAALAKKYPASFEVVESLGVLYAEQDRTADALPLLERAAKLRPGSAVALANLGAAYFKLNRTVEAVRPLSRAAALDPANAQTQSDLGQALLATSQPRLAAEAFKRASAASTGGPPSDDLLYNWALALFESGELVRAAGTLARATNLSSSAAAQSLAADIAEQQKDYKSAVEHYQRAADLDPSESNLYLLGLEFLRHWTFEPAAKVFEFGSRKYPGSRRMLAGLGIARYSSNDYTAAAPVFAQLLATDPDNAFYADLLGHSCSLMPDDAAGCAPLKDFAERHPKNATAATYAAASILHRPSGEENLRLAAALLQQALTADPKLAEAWYQSGILSQMRGDWAGSTAKLEEAVALKPTFAKAHYRLALAYSHTGRRDEAQREIALNQKYSEQEKDDLNMRFKQVTMFLVAQNAERQK